MEPLSKAIDDHISLSRRQVVRRGNHFRFFAKCAATIIVDHFGRFCRQQHIVHHIL